MGKVAIVTDSTAYVPAQAASQLPIEVIPLHLNWSGRNFDDGVNIQPEWFFNELKTAPELPKTSQIPVSEFCSLYKKLLDQGYEILSIHISSKISGTFEAAKSAVTELAASSKIKIMDSMSGAAAQAFMVMQAAKAACSGASLDDCLHEAEEVRGHSHIYFIPGSLESLHRGGRIGGAAAWFGSLLNIHPILETRNGIIDAVEKVRTMSKAMARVVDMLNVRVGDSQTISLAGLYADSPQLADQLVQMTTQKIGAERVQESFTTTISPVLGTHIGPGSVGIAFVYR
jgi:DegV family protein with EDD domain